QLVVRQQRLLRLDLPELQRSQDRLAGPVHEGGRLQQPDVVATDAHPCRLSEKPEFEPEMRAPGRAEGIDQAAAGVMPVKWMPGTWIPQADDETQCRHCDAMQPHPARRTGRDACRLLGLFVRSRGLFGLDTGVLG